MIGRALRTLVRVLLALWGFALAAAALLALAAPGWLDSEAREPAPLALRAPHAIVLLGCAAFLALEPSWLRARPRLLWPLAAAAALVTALAGWRAWTADPRQWLEWTALLALPCAAQAVWIQAGMPPPASPLRTLARLLMMLWALALATNAAQEWAWSTWHVTDILPRPLPMERALFAVAQFGLAAFLALDPAWLRARPCWLWPLAVVAAAVSAFAGWHPWTGRSEDSLAWTALLALSCVAQVIWIQAAPPPPASPRSTA